MKINNGAFAYCDLGAVELPNGISELGNRLFYGCNSLEDVKLPSNLKKIGDEAFAYCQALNSIVLPDGVTELGNNVFTGCKSLEDVKLPSNLKRWESMFFILFFIEKSTFARNAFRNSKRCISRLLFSLCFNSRKYKYDWSRGI